MWLLAWTLVRRQAWPPESLSAVLVTGAVAALVAEVADPAAVVPAAAVFPAAAPLAAVASAAAFFDLDFVVEAASLAVAVASAVPAFLDFVDFFAVEASLDAAVESAAASAALVLDFDFDFDVLASLAAVVESVVASAVLVLDFDFDFDIAPLSAVWLAASVLFVLDFELDLVVPALESVVVESSAAFVFDLDLDFDFGFAVLVSLWSVVVCCPTATRTETLPATSAGVYPTDSKIEVCDNESFRVFLSPRHLWSLNWHTGGVCFRVGVKTTNKCLARIPLGMGE